MNTYSQQKHKHQQQTLGGLPPCAIRLNSWSAGESQRMRRAWPTQTWTHGRGPCLPAIASRPLLAITGTVLRYAGGWLEGKGPNDVGIRVPCVHKAGWANNLQKQQKQTEGGRPRPPSGHPGGHPKIQFRIGFRSSPNTPCVCKPGMAEHKQDNQQTEACIPLRHQSSNRAVLQSPRVTRLGPSRFPGSSLARLRVDRCLFGRLYIRIPYPNYP